jgi:lysophospholipase L1-like esterase
MLSRIKPKNMLRSRIISNCLHSFLFAGLVVTGISCSPELKQNLVRYNFGGEKESKAYVNTGPDTRYSETDTFGFLPGPELMAGKLSSGKLPDREYIYSKEPFIFLADAAEGNYDVKVTSVGMRGGSHLTLKTESRRLIVRDLEIPEGETRTIRFTTNVRWPEISEGREVRRKPREFGHFNWDPCLSIEFNGKNPAISSVEISRNDEAITIFLAGNSTVTDPRHEPYSAWGQMLPSFFKPGLVAVANHAEAGETLKSFIGEKRLEKLFSQVRPGDYLMIQFAHNDQKTKSSSYSPPFTDYQDYLRRFISEARNLGVSPILVTPLLRRSFDENGKIINTHGDYPAAMKQVAEEEDVPLIDLFSMSKVLYEALGPEESKHIFLHFPAGTFPGQDKALKDNTHQSTYGAYELSKCVVQGIRERHPELAKYLREDLPDFDPASPAPFSTWDLARSPLNNQ